MSMDRLITELRAEEQLHLKRLEQCRESLRELLGDDGDDSAPVASLEEFLSERNTDFQWIIGGSIATGSVGMLVADPAVGKTTLLVQLALCLSVGRSPWYHAPVSRVVPTLYVIAEGSRAAFQARVDTARESLDVPRDAGWFIQQKHVTDYKIGGSTLEAMIRRSRAGLVILDTVGYFWTGDENSAVEWKASVMKPLRDMVARYGCTFLLVHHQVKATINRTGWQKARGTSAMFADLDFFWQLEPVEGDDVGTARNLVQSKNKYGQVQRWDLRFDATRARFG